VLATLTIAAPFCIGLALVLLLAVGDPQALIPAALGAALIWPLVPLMRNNAPRECTARLYARRAPRRAAVVVSSRPVQGV
jgi:hypothetical protein